MVALLIRGGGCWRWGFASRKFAGSKRRGGRTGGGILLGVNLPQATAISEGRKIATFRKRQGSRSGGDVPVPANLPEREKGRATKKARYAGHTLLSDVLFFSAENCLNPGA